ncbi:TPA: hypothetical protein ACR8QY_002454 [Enterobacter roggenkampii]|uniref:hypothetical protein n=1 Tax=Enterobacter cloacae complex TaxID=354276 RepID=UPI002074D493|nr:hypothetical protein [Enterobacter cloacae]MCM7814664.1 hypothetical protein [Enterobacter hormaechei]MEB7117780.1 hypothetical protein [Enterobacter cloacae]
MHEIDILCVIILLCEVFMAFRAEEAAAANFERAYRYLVPQGATQEMRFKIREKLKEIVEECGPVVEGYPAWHPFMMEADNTSWAPTTPKSTNSFNYLDHTVYFRNGILTCPYGHGVDEFIQTIRNLKHRDAFITIERVENVVLYNDAAVPLLIKCDWNISEEMEADGTIPPKVAIGLMLENEVPNWRNAVYCESWEDMRGQLMGYPFGARSSLFVNQQTGQKMKNFWNHLIKTGLLGEER